jgi:hypothetical protein
MVVVGERGTVRFSNAAGETPMLSGVSPDGKGNYVLVGDKGADLFRAN